MNNNYYKTLSGLLQKQYAKQLETRDLKLHIPYNGLYIYSYYEFTRDKSVPMWSFNSHSLRRVYVITEKISHVYGNGNEYITYKPLAKYRITLVAALRTADRILDKGIDEWRKPISTS